MFSWFSRGPKIVCRHAVLEPLEERIVLDGSVAATPTDRPPAHTDSAPGGAAADHVTVPQPAEATAADHSAHDPKHADPSAIAVDQNSIYAIIAGEHTLIDTVALQPDNQGGSSETVHLLLISSDVDGAAELAQAAGENTIAVIYDASTETPYTLLSIIEAALAGKHADSIAFATHESGEAQFQLTDGSNVSLGTLLSDPVLQTFWQDVGDLLKEDGRIDILACDLGATDTGKLLVSELETLSGHSVDASTDATGNPQYGGDWILEIGNIDLVAEYFTADGIDLFYGTLSTTHDPTVVGQSVSMNEDGTLTITVAGYDADQPDVSEVHFDIATDVDHGTLTYVAGSLKQDTVDPTKYTAQFIYDPDDNYHGTDNFQFTFTTPTWSGYGSAVAVGSAAYTESIVLGDLNGDGKLDMVQGIDGEYPKVYLGNGDGTFTYKCDLSQLGSIVALGDVNGDGKLDVIQASPSDSNYDNVYLGNGDGTFTWKDQLDTAPSLQVSSIALGDVNGDGDPDVVLGVYESVVPSVVLLGNGDGTFTAVASLADCDQSVALGDMNGDGKLDAILVNYDEPSQVFLGNGNGTFTYKCDLSGTASSTSIALGDLNGDGKVDLVLGNGVADDSTVYLGNGDGTFTYKCDLSGTRYVQSIALGDVNCDGVLDVVTVSYGSATKVYLGNGDGTFTYTCDVGGTSYSFAMSVRCEPRWYARCGPRGLWFIHQGLFGRGQRDGDLRRGESQDPSAQC